MSKEKISNKSFKFLLVTQFLGAFNDNAFKIIISLMGIQLIFNVDSRAGFVSMVGALFVIPFILFSPVAGYLADKFSKRDVIVSMKIFELMIMVLGLIALIKANLIFLCAVLFLMSAQSAFFSPAKYGLLPEILPNKNLSRGNGYLQMFTFIAIILGSAFGGRIKEVVGAQVWRCSLILILLSVLGLLASFFIEKSTAQRPEAVFQANGFKRSFSILKQIKKDKALFLTLLGIAYFWFLGAVFQMNILLYAKNYLSITDSQTGILLAVVALGIGVGSVLAGRFSEGKIEFGLVPLGSIGLSIFSLVLGTIVSSYLSACLVLFFLGLSSGFYTIPLNAFFQRESPEKERGEFLATLNIITSLAILSGSFFIWLIGSKFGFDPAQTFVVLGVVSIIATIYIVWTLPIAFVRLINWFITHSLYRLKVFGLENIPQKKGALIVCNHVSYMDATVTLASLNRPVRFIMYRKIYNIPIIHTICKIMKVIPVDYQDGPKGIMRSLQTAKEAIEAGDLVCIFPEGGLTRTGNMLAFNRGFEKIMQGIDAPIIPMYLDNIWGSLFSFSKGKYFFKIPKKLPYPLTLIIGQAMPSESRVYQLRLAVQELGAEACKLRGIYRKKLHISFIENAKKNPFKFCMADSSGLRFNYLKALASMILMKGKLFPKSRRPLETNEMIGVLLPASTMAAITNGAIFFAGKVPVNLNFTFSYSAIEECVKACRIKTIVTSRKFIDKANIKSSNEMVFLEDIKSRITSAEKLLAYLISLFMPKSLIKLFCVRSDKKNVDDVASVIFSSGSTGQPKGIMLSHGNIFSNIEGFYQVFDVNPKDVIVGALPFFHSFGFTATMCFPLGCGIGVVYHANPMDATTIGRLVEKYKATIIMGTPTFLSAYLRRCSKEQFKTIRCAVAGAEKLKEKLTKAFFEKYGIIPFEGYGATELSPIVSVGYPDYLSANKKIHQVGHKAGSVGHPIPGVAVKIVNPETFEILPYDTEGLLLVKGPNVMKGYLNDPLKTEEVIRDGWYVTGDIAIIDSDGFITITDRLSRFSKIGGEMVPHIKVEEKIMEILGATETICAVTSAKDEKKGERLVVLYVGDIDIDWLHRSLAEGDLPNLWLPKKENFFQVKEIPLLGTGKVDLKAIKAMAAELLF
ncbi:MAG: acyl-[ACP]--phospholipid O-acyltransferase [Candidatus Omnitrophica bacterium]|nr:acyl-[ACP]--phospholipid O-acyltransferase [Candidatus Omnitrophota bacterium]